MNRIRKNSEQDEARDGLFNLNEKEHVVLEMAIENAKKLEKFNNELLVFKL